MSAQNDTLDRIGLHVPTILLPRPGTDLTRWAVVACDQFTSEPEYWHRVEARIAHHPSTGHLILPEVYLETDEEERRLERIQATMQTYLADGVLQPQSPGFVLLDRQTAHVPSRKGLMVALDLEHYSYEDGAQTLIRATEGTILDRLPPRVKIREQAPLELPHIMVLIDDPGRTVIEPLFDHRDTPLYDVELMEGGGHLRGWRIDDAAHIARIADALAALATPAQMKDKYGIHTDAPLLYAMGDGNHSFATAKAVWQRIKDEADRFASVADHPARHALVELVNLHDDGLQFEPIHRVLFGVDAETLLADAQAWLAQAGAPARRHTFDTPARAVAMAGEINSNHGHALLFVTPETTGLLAVRDPQHTLAVGTLQPFLDAWLQEHPAAHIDYVHGDDVVNRLGRAPGNMGFFLPAMDKSDLFRTVLADGALPRKTFSMGEAEEKRYYMEARRIVL